MGQAALTDLRSGNYTVAFPEAVCGVQIAGDFSIDFKSIMHEQD